MRGEHDGHTQYLQGNVQQCAVVIVEGRLEPPQEGQKAAMLKQKILLLWISGIAAVCEVCVGLNFVHETVLSD